MPFCVRHVGRNSRFRGVSKMAPHIFGIPLRGPSPSLSPSTRQRPRWRSTRPRSLSDVRCEPRYIATIPADCRSSPILKSFTSHPGKAPNVRHRSRLPENRRPRRLCGCRSQCMGRPRHQNLNQRSRCWHSASGKAARSHPLCRKGDWRTSCHASDVIRCNCNK